MGKGQRIKIERRAKREAQIRQAATESSPIMVKCPETGKFFATGFDASPEAFNTSDFVDATSTCPLCGMTHRWGDSEMVLAN